MRPRNPGTLELLRAGRIEVQARLADASNASLFCTISGDGLTAECVYKPVVGEQPLWDFPDGTLAGREVATYLISEAAGLCLVPPTVFRPGPFGPGMVQLWVDTKDDEDLVDVVAAGEVPDGWRTVLHARDGSGEPAVLVHADHPSIRMMAALDVVVNNADRKGGHVLHAADGAVYGVDHGICLHTENKLRTVLWGFLGEPLPEAAIDALQRLRCALDVELAEGLAKHITRGEIRALVTRVDRLIQHRVYPGPANAHRAVPWPAF